MNKYTANDARQKRVLLNDWLQQGCIIFTGAGISVSPPSSIPVSNQIKRAILTSLLSFVDEDFKYKGSIEICLTNHFYEIKMETLFEVFIRNGITNVFECLRIFTKAFPNLDHLTIALLCKLGFVKAIFTLNFDLLHESAMKILGIPYTAYLKDEDYYYYKYDANNKDIPVFHLHNGFLPNDSEDLGHLNAATSKVRSFLPHQKADIFIKHLGSKPVFCAGYSNNDIDTFRYIENFGTKIIWYSHDINERIPDRVQNLKAHKNTDFLHIIRNEEVLNETCFSDVIFNVIGNNNRGTLEDICNKGHITSLSENIKYIENKIQNLINSSSISLLLMSDLLDILNERELALNTLSDKYWKCNYKSNNNLINFNRARILAHLYERLDHSRKALKYSNQCIKLSGNNLSYYILRISTLLGILKREPYNIFIFFDYIIEKNKLNKRLSNNPTSFSGDEFQLFLFEKADFYDFLGGYLFFPSIIYLKLVLGSKRHFDSKVVKRYLSNRVLRIFDKIVIAFMGAILKILENKAFKYYSQVARNTETARGHAFLSACRSVEVLCFQKKFSEASNYLTILEDGLLFFDFSNELHGKGNIYLALYLYYYGISNSKYKIYYKKAKSHYHSHFPGLFKLMTMRYRVENNIYLI
ncbi:MAG TPA: SIR2 family protein [Brevefilum sp.]|nr:SIR2 family protein [Brevefilum sp.]HPL69097.1 SIR2 family protein [Brevefilum sp.]